jgi:transposase
MFKRPWKQIRIILHVNTARYHSFLVMIDGQIRGSAVWIEKQDLLASVLGVGKTIARTLIAAELGSLDRREIAALVGFAPWTRQSGQWRGKSFIGGGRTQLLVRLLVRRRHGRCALQSALKSFRDKLVAAGKPKLIALVAVARKLITILSAILRERRPWQPTLLI